MKRRRKRLMVIIPVAAVCVAGAGTVGYFKVAHTKPAQMRIAWSRQKMRLQSS